MGKRRSKDRVHARNNPGDLATQRRRAGEHEAVVEGGAAADRVINAPVGTPTFWPWLLKRWQRLTPAQKTSWVLLGLLAGGVTLVAAYYYLPIFLEGMERSAGSSPCLGFKTVYGDPSTARFVFIGESHKHKDDAARCLDTLASTGGNHVVLVESAPVGLQVPCRDYEVPEAEGRICKGWDDESRLVESHVAYLDEIHNIFLDTLASHFRHYADPQKDQLLVNLINTLLEKCEALRASIAPRTVADGLSRIDYSHDELDYIMSQMQLKILKQLQTQRKSGKSFVKILAELRVEPTEHVKQSEATWKEEDGKWAVDWKIMSDDSETVAETQKRQASLIAAVAGERVADSARRVFVHAGVFHVHIDRPKGVPPDALVAALEESIAKLLADCTPGECAVLATTRIPGL